MHRRGPSRGVAVASKHRNKDFSVNRMTRRFQRICLFLAAGTLCLPGCHSWSPSSVSRVPPPGTGTYQLPQGYYNNASPPAGQSTAIPAQASAGAVVGTQPTVVSPVGSGPLPTAGAAPASGVQPVNGALPTTSLSSGANPAPVQPAGFAAPATGAASESAPTFVTPSFAAPPTGMPATGGSLPAGSSVVPAAGSLSDSADPPAALNWQTP